MATEERPSTWCDICDSADGTTVLIVPAYDDDFPLMFWWCGEESCNPNEKLNAIHDELVGAQEFLSKSPDGVPGHLSM